MTRHLAFTILLMLAAAPALAQCAGGVCIAPSPFSAPAPNALVAQSLAASTVRIVNDEGSARSIGSGAIVDKRGGAALVLTCGHLFRDGIGRVVVVAPEGRTYAARVLDVDASWDIAVLMIGAPDAPAIPLATSSPGGSEVLAYAGYGPDGRFAGGAGRLLGYVQMQGTPTADTLQLAGAARQGDSGGPIVNARGQIVGLIVGTNGRIVIGPSCRPIRRFLERFVGPADPAPGRAGGRVPAAGNDAARPQPAAPRSPVGNGAERQAAAPPHREGARAQAQNPAERPAAESSRPHSVESVHGAPSSTSAGTVGANDVLAILLPLLLASLGISVPPTSVFVALRVLRCMRRSHLRKRRRQRRNRQGQPTNDKQQPDPCPRPGDQAACDRRRVALERHLNDDYAAQLASVFAHSGQSPLQDATLGREFSREIDRAAGSSDAKLAAWAAELRDRVMRRFHRIHGWSPSPAEPTE
jgi:hypothetical protein